MDRTKARDVGEGDEVGGGYRMARMVRIG